MVSHEGIRLYSDVKLESPPVASFLSKKYKMMSEETENLEKDLNENNEDQASSLFFDVVHRSKWDLSRSIKLINQSEPSIAPHSKTELPSPSVLDSLDLAGTSLNKEQDKVVASSHLRSKSEILEKNTYENQGIDSVQALGIIVKNDSLRSVGGSDSGNIGEVEDDDEIVDDNEIVVDSNTKREDIKGLC